MLQSNTKVAIELYVDDKGSVRVKEFSGKSQEEFRKVEQSGVGSASKIGAAWDKVKGVWGWIAAGATAAVAAVSALVITSAREAKEMENLARLAKMGSEEFRAYAFATESVGVSAEKLADISKDVQDKIGDFIATGGGEFADFFENVAPKVGLTAQELQKLSGPDVLVALKKAMDDANISAEEQVFYLEAIGNDAALLTPLLEENGKALKEKAQRAKELGLAISEVDNKKLVDAGVATNEATSAFGGLKNAVAAEFAPIFTEVMNWATGLIVGFKEEARSIAGTFVNIAESFKGWKAVFDGRLSFFEFAKMDAKEFDGWLEKNRVSTAALADESVKAQSSYRTQIEGTTNALKYQEKERQKILDKHKSEAEEKAAAEREMYEEAGFGAEKYFTQEANELVRKSIRWKEAGADIYEVEQWLYDEIGKLAADAYEEGELAAGVAMTRMQEQSGTLAEQFAKKTEEMNSQLIAVGVEADELNGKTIGLQAHFDGSAVVTGIDGLIAKFEQLQRAAAAAPAEPTSSSSAPSGSYENTDASMSASEVAAAGTAHNGKNAQGGVTVNINQQVSRSDVISIVSEQRRLEARS
ncbi:MAG: hypothetical protein VR65_20030 [Desulfobulbaceae bacterium BRH_c16a]|nr:MAG: hypothetical protein VR65_20030 [Desulfobulbaceae bacterium BRH_c16a]